MNALATNQIDEAKTKLLTLIDKTYVDEEQEETYFPV